MEHIADLCLRFLGDVVPSEKFLVEIPSEIPVVVNLECPITKAKVPAQGKVVLKAEVDWLTTAFGKNLLVVCLANNHIMDYGSEGFADTVALLEKSGVAWFGAGNCLAEVRNGVVLDIGNHRIGFCGYVCPSTHPVFATLNMPGVVPLDLELIRADLRAARAKGAERIVVCLHWGDEEVPYPKPDDIALARTISEIGADLIIGHHSHCIQPYEIYRGCPIFYGIGNAVMPDLDVPCDYNAAQQPGCQFVKKQRPWNRRSLTVDYFIKTNQVLVRKLNFNGYNLIFQKPLVPASRLLEGESSRQDRFFHFARLFGQFRNLVASFAERPRMPRLHHLRSLWLFSRKS